MISVILKPLFHSSRFIKRSYGKRLQNYKSIGLKVERRKLHKSYNLSYREQISDSSIPDHIRGRNFHLYNGNKLYNENQYEQAIEEYLKALKFDSDFPELYVNLAICYEKLGDLEKSKEYTFSAIKKGENKLKPSDLSIEYERLSRIALLEGRYLYSHLYIREAISLHPSDELSDTLAHISKVLALKYTPSRLAKINADNLPFIQLLRNRNIEFRQTPNGLGLFTTIDLPKGSIILEESPIVSIVNVESKETNHCQYCKKLLHDVELSFGSPEIEQMAKAMGDEGLNAMKSDIINGLKLPQIQITYDKDGDKFCSSKCKDLAYNEYKKYLEDKNLDENIKKILFPSNYIKEYDIESYLQNNRYLYLSDLSTIEMITYLLCKLSLHPELEKNIQSLSYMKVTPQIMLLKHEKDQLNALRQLFPQFKDKYLTEKGFLELKSLIIQNSYSIETHALKIELCLAQHGKNEVPDDVDTESAEMLNLNMQYNEDVIFKGHSLLEIGSFFNHSCDPNIGFTVPSLTNRSCWIALKDIQKGEELLSSYIALDDVKHDRELRRKIIKDKFHFECECSYCKSGN